MKMEFGEYEKGMSPPHATIDIRVVELAENEYFDEPTLKKVVKKIVENDQPKYDKMKFESWKTFFGVFKFEYMGNNIKIIEYPLYTNSVN